MGSGAKEVPVPFGCARVFESHRLECILDLRGQQIAVLKSDLRGRAFQMNVGPSILLEAIRLFQAGVGGWIDLPGPGHYGPGANGQQQSDSDGQEKEEDERGTHSGSGRQCAPGYGSIIVRGEV